MAECLFIGDWGCPVEGDVPLDVCKTCVRARETASDGGITIPRPEAPSSPERRERSLEEKILPEEGAAASEGGGARELRELDRRFSKGGIGMDEYIDRRKSITESG